MTTCHLTFAMGSACTCAARGKKQTLPRKRFLQFSFVLACIAVMQCIVMASCDREDGNLPKLRQLHRVPTAGAAPLLQWVCIPFCSEVFLLEFCWHEAGMFIDLWYLGFSCFHGASASCNYIIFIYIYHYCHAWFMSVDDCTKQH